MLTLRTLSHEVVVHAPTGAVKVVRRPVGHSRWEIAALLATLSLTLPVGLLMLLGL
jgi:hypothetical protein